MARKQQPPRPAAAVAAVAPATAAAPADPDAIALGSRWRRRAGHWTGLVMTVVKVPARGEQWPLYSLDAAGLVTWRGTAAELRRDFERANG